METNNMNGINETIPFAATHPTEIIKDEIKARGMSQKELAERMGMKTSNLSRLLHGENITPSIAAKLESALDIPADMWLKLQAQFDRDTKIIALREEKEREAYTIEKMLSTLLNLPELYKRLNISPSNFIQKKLEILESYLKFKPLMIGKKAFIQQSCYKKSEKLTSDEKNQNTWLTLAYIQAVKTPPIGNYSRGNGVSAAKKIVEEVHNGNITETKIGEILSEYGISYSVVAKVDKTHIDAASFYVDKYPAIVTTHRYNDMSMLIFNILHEIGHIEFHLSNEPEYVFISSEETYSFENKQEKEANTFAENMLIDKMVWAKMMNSESNGISTRNIVDKLRTLSKEYGLDFNIVVWRYKHESRNYKLFGIKSIRIR